MVDTKKETVELRVRGANLSISTIFRSGTGAPILFLHGFGSTKEDYADIARVKVFSGRPFIAYDAPGCGESMCSDLSAVDIPFLVETARAVLDHLQVQRFHVVGHSMGGLTSLMLADEEHERVISFIDIEGNVAPEDCFLSRQIFTHRVVQVDSGRPVEIAGVTVHEDDYVIADRCGTVFVPAARIDEVLDLGERIARRQDGMVAAVRTGRSVAEVMHDKEFEAIRVR